MTGIAICRRPGELSIDMAARTRHRHMGPRQRKAREGVINAGGNPGQSAVAEGAILRIISRPMIGICNAIVIVQMTGYAC